MGSTFPCFLVRMLWVDQLSWTLFWSQGSTLFWSQDPSLAENEGQSENANTNTQPFAEFTPGMGIKCNNHHEEEAVIV